MRGSKTRTRYVPSAGNTHAYEVLAAMLDDRNPPGEREELVNRAKRADAFKRLKGVAARRNRAR